MVGKSNSGSAKLYAAIGVTYPAGSNLTCTGGGQTWTAKTSSGKWVFALPKAGTYTVTATDGSHSKSRSVSITAEGQFASVNLSYGLVLFASGESGVELTTKKGSNGSVTISEDKIITSYTSSNSGAGNFGTVQTYDLTNYKTMRVKVYCIDYSNTPTFVVSTDTVPSTSAITNVVAKLEIPKNTVATEYTLDISKISGAHYLYFAGVSKTETYLWILEE